MRWLDWTVIAAVAALFGLSIFAQWRKRRRGGSSCGSCGGCPMAGQCGGAKRAEEQKPSSKHDAVKKK